MLNNAVRSVRTQPSTSLFSSPLFPNQIRRNNSPGLCFKQPAAATTGANHNTESQKPAADDHHMDKQEKINNRTLKTGDEMSHSFGEGYATRSDEEGFGGIYGGSDPLSKEEKAKIIHENHPEYDKTQGSEVAEKEKAQHPKIA